MRLCNSLLSALCLLTCAVVASAEERTPNTLTPKEIADGWILLFDGSTTFGWKTDKDSKVHDDCLFLRSDATTSAQANTQFSAFELKFDFRRTNDGDAAIVFGEKHNSRFGLFGTNGIDWGTATIKYTAGQGGKVESEFELKTGNSVSRSSGSGSSSQMGRTPIRFESSQGCELFIANLRLKPLGMKSIFNGKDLSGWKVIPGYKSVFSVTEMGELNIKNGKGDIHTEGQWADFVLQLDIISQGKHLNSGVFFRCLPDVFWSGYESQIRNQWEIDKTTQKEDRTKPVDYGTGGLYNRQKARKVVSTDNEWFTMTVVAHGNHLSTWVNGYQTTDFYDTRPMHKSAREGQKLDKGPISLQGHDPTTNLSFRNIKIAESAK